MSASEQTSQTPQNLNQAPAEAGAAVPETSTIVASTEERLAELEAKHAEVADAYLRAKAEVENTRRRADEEVAKARKFALESFAESLLPVRDSLEMALKVDTPTVEALKEGVEATLQLMASVFEKNKLLVIDPAGEKFDPNRHQAISMVPAGAVNPPVPANHVVTVLQKGYLLSERVIRPAMVMVSKGKAQ